MSQEDKGK
jgi:hypothetical protein